MTVAVIGAGNIGSRVARRLAEGGVDVVIAAENRGHAESVAQSIGNGVRAVEVAEAVASADQLVFATWFPTTKDLLVQYEPQLVGKIVIDPSNNIAFDESGGVRSLNPEGVSSRRSARCLPTSSTQRSPTPASGPCCSMPRTTRRRATSSPT